MGCFFLRRQWGSGYSRRSHDHARPLARSHVAGSLTLIRPLSVKGESDPERDCGAVAWVWGGRCSEKALSDFISIRGLQTVICAKHLSRLDRQAADAAWTWRAERGISLRGLETHLFPRSGRFKRASCGGVAATLSYLPARVRGRAAVLSAPIAEQVVERERMSNQAEGTRVHGHDARGARSMPHEKRASERLYHRSGPVRRRAHPLPSPVQAALRNRPISNAVWRLSMK